MVSVTPRLVARELGSRFGEGEVVTAQSLMGCCAKILDQGAGNQQKIFDTSWKRSPRCAGS